MNSNFSRKRSSSTFPPSKKFKVSVEPPPEKVSVPQVMSTTIAADELLSNEIPSGDWLTAMCQSLGEIPVIDLTSDDSPQLIIDAPEHLPIKPSTLDESAHNEITRSTDLGIESEPPSTADPRIEPQPPRPIDEVTSRKSSEVLHVWDLDNNLTVSLHRSEWKLHIHINKNSQHIVMTIPTYCDFKNQLPKIGIPFERPNIICNKQLAVFTHSDKLILQQIFHFEHFKLKNHSLELNSFDQNNLEGIFQHIDDVIKVSIFESVLCEQLPKMPHKMQVNDELDLLHEFMKIVNDEISRHVKTLFECYGCKLSSPGQRSHDCINIDYKTQCRIVGEDTILLLDPRRIANVLQDKGILHHFNNDFFKYNLIRSQMEM